MSRTPPVRPYPRTISSRDCADPPVRPGPGKAHRPHGPIERARELPAAGGSLRILPPGAVPAQADAAAPVVPPGRPLSRYGGRRRTATAARSPRTVGQRPPGGRTRHRGRGGAADPGGRGVLWRAPTAYSSCSVLRTWSEPCTREGLGGSPVAARAFGAELDLAPAFAAVRQAAHDSAFLLPPS